jgi:hypothetical protein
MMRASGYSFTLCPGLITPRMRKDQGLRGLCGRRSRPVDELWDKGIGADPQRKYNGVSALEGARSRGHWLAVELMESRLS